MSSLGPQYLAGTTQHRRTGAVAHGFGYRVDYVLVDPEADDGPRLFSRNRFNLAAVHDRDHGGPRGAGRGGAWAREVLAAHGLDGIDELKLLTQPRTLGYVFNPVSFWLAYRGDDLCAVIAEVNNTYGDRHSYLCRHADFAPIRAGDLLAAAKVFHVSPFQEIAGGYRFSFDLSDTRVAIRIAHGNGPEGLVATLAGPLEPLRSRHLVRAALRWPGGPLRAIALIHWQALRLALKGAPFRARPAPPVEEIT